MSSILTNNGASTALATLRSVNDNLSETQSRISTGLAVRSGKDNAAYFSIAKTMEGDSGMYKAVQEGMTLAKNSVSTSRMGAEKVVELTSEFAERVAFAQGDTVDKVEVGKELAELNKRIQTTIDQSSFNGHSLINGTQAAASGNLTVVTGIKRDTGFDVSTTDINGHNLARVVATNDKTSATSEGFATASLSGYNTTAAQATRTATDVSLNLGDVAAYLQNHDTAALSSADMSNLLKATEATLEFSINAATELGVGEKTLETQQDFLSNLTDQLDSGVGAMVDANMEEEAARLQALQVQQQLSVQALSIANQAPQNIMSLFR